MFGSWKIMDAMSKLQNLIAIAQQLEYKRFAEGVTPTASDFDSL